MSFNKVIILGNHARDPEMRYLPKGTAVTDFTLAVNREWKSESGEKKSEVSFIDCVAFSRHAEVVAKYFHKGDPMLCEGRLKQETWEDKNGGGKRSRLKVIMESFSFVGGKKDAGESGPAPIHNRQKTASEIAKESAAPSDAPAPEEDDVPF
jgi:single-strand DNA-binding protein